MTAPPASPLETTEDAFFGGALRILQPKRGHRIGTDAVLLAAACPAEAITVCDLGSGAGVVGLRAAQMQPERRVCLIEQDAATAALAAGNAARNDLSGRADIVTADALAKGFAAGDGLAGRFDVVLTNPPFGDAGSMRVSPDARRAAAHTLAGDLDGWLRAALRLLRPGGELVMIHRADRLGDLLALTARRFGALRLRFIHPRAASPAHRLLLCGRKGARGPLAILPPLVLHGPDGAFTPEAEAIHRGAAPVSWR